jgi:TRAP-type mannitol/chloroaromatic compound transport system permease large subunit
VFQGVDGPRWVERLLTSLPGGQVGFLIVVNLLIFFLAFFLDFFELSFIVVPLIGPVAEKLGIDLIWFGVLLGVNMQTSFMHPPFGFALFYLRSVAPDKEYVDKLTRKTIPGVSTMQIYWGAVPFVIIQIIMVALIITFPKIVSRDVEPAVDLDKVKIEMPSDMPNYTPGAAPGSSDPFAPPSGPDAQPGTPASPSSGDDEQKKMDELFGTKKK